MRRVMGGRGRLLRADTVEVDVEDDEPYPLSLPLKTEWFRSATVEKRIVTTAVTWQRRLLVMTDKHLLFAKHNSDRVVACIPLVEVAKVQMSDSGKDADPSRASKMRPSIRPSRTSDGEQKVRYSRERSGSVTSLGVSVKRLKEDGSPVVTEPVCFEVFTEDLGMNAGRTFSLSCDTTKEAEEWIEAIKIQRKAAVHERQRRNQKSRFDEWRIYLKKRYQHQITQTIIACIIIASFVSNILVVEVIPEDGSTEEQIFQAFDYLVLAIFTIELMLNVFISWLRPFFEDGWNIFDMIVVLSSVVSLFLENVPGFNLLRLVRVLRVVRIFRRLESLRSIVNALTASIIPVAHSFVVLVLVTCIYAVLGVHLFKDKDSYLFGYFSASLFTMFQVCTGDNWAKDVARPMMSDEGDQDQRINRGVALFFVSYVLIAGVVLINIVVAVTLDEFIGAVEAEKNEKYKRKERFRHNAAANLAGALDPVLHSLSKFTSSQDLTESISSLFNILDHDDTATLNFEKLQTGLKLLPLRPRVFLSQEDFDVLTDNGALTDDAGQLNFRSFERAIRKQLQLYVQRHIATAIDHASRDGEPHSSTTLFALKLLTISVHDLSQNEEGEGGSKTISRMRQLERTVASMDGKVDVLLRRVDAVGQQQPRDSVARSPLNTILKHFDNGHANGTSTRGTKERDGLMPARKARGGSSPFPRKGSDNEVVLVQSHGGSGQTRSNGPQDSDLPPLLLKPMKQLRPKMSLGRGSVTGGMWGTRDKTEERQGRYGGKEELPSAFSSVASSPLGAGRSEESDIKSLRHSANRYRESIGNRRTSSGGVQSKHALADSLNNSKKSPQRASKSTSPHRRRPSVNKSEDEGGVSMDIDNSSEDEERGTRPGTQGLNGLPYLLPPRKKLQSPLANDDDDDDDSPLAMSRRPTNMHKFRAKRASPHDAHARSSPPGHHTRSSPPLHPARSSTPVNPRASPGNLLPPYSTKPPRSPRGGELRLVHLDDEEVLQDDLVVGPQLPSCGGCSQCCYGYRDVGVLLSAGGRSVYLRVDTFHSQVREFRGPTPQSAAMRPSQIGSNLGFAAERLLRDELSNFEGAIDPTRYIDNLHQDGKHLYRCFVLPYKQANKYHGALRFEDGTIQVAPGSHVHADASTRKVLARLLLSPLLTSHASPKALLREERSPALPVDMPRAASRALRRNRDEDPPTGSTDLPRSSLERLRDPGSRVLAISRSLARERTPVDEELLPPRDVRSRYGAGWQGRGIETSRGGRQLRYSQL